MKLNHETMRQFAHRANVARCQQILETHLTDEERRFVERRLAEERAALQQLAGGVAPSDDRRLQHS